MQWPTLSQSRLIVSVQITRLIFAPCQKRRKERKRRDNAKENNGICKRHDYLPFSIIDCLERDRPSALTYIKALSREIL